MIKIQVPRLATAAGAVDEAERLVNNLLYLLQDTEGPELAETVHILSTTARLYLLQADEGFLHPKLQPRYRKVHDTLRDINTGFYQEFPIDDLRRLAVERYGFVHPECIGWDEDRPTGSLLLILNDAYEPDIPEKVRVQACAYERAGFPAHAEQLREQADSLQRELKARAQFTDVG